VSTYVRDWHIQNLTLNQAKVEALYEAVDTIATDLNLKFSSQGNSMRARTSCVIRHGDGLGDRAYLKDFLLSVYRRSFQVERIIYMVEIFDPSSDLNQIAVQIQLDTQRDNNFLTVSSVDDWDWVQKTFSFLRDELKKSRNYHGYFRAPLSKLCVQLLGVAASFLSSILFAQILAPKIAIQEAFLVSFVFFFLLFANIWTYVQQAVLNSINTFFSSIKFLPYGKEQFHWLPQALIGSAVVSVLGIMLVQALNILGDFFSGILK